MAIKHWLQLSLTKGIGPVLCRRLIDACGNAEEACHISLKILSNIEGIGSKKSDSILRALREAADLAELELARAAQLGVSIISVEDEIYPMLLRSIPDPPIVLYVRGTLEPRDLNAIAIVGSRQCSYYGREQAERFGALLAGAGFTIVSGGARGIDSAAHRGALSHPQGRTIAVLGSGIDVPYPPENTSLFDQIATRGAVVSEYPLGTPPLADNFPRRNRIVSGMSRGVLVTEAAERSGALITARQAADDHGRPVFALPGRVDNLMSAGPHQLIRDGAVLTTKIDDILQNLGPMPDEVYQPADIDKVAKKSIPLTAPNYADDYVGIFNHDEDGSLFSPAAKTPVAAEVHKPIPSLLSDSQNSLLEQLNADELNVDRLVERTGLPASKILSDLTLLSLKGLVKRLDGQTYKRV